MLRKYNKIKKAFKEEIKQTHGRVSVTVYLTLRLLVIICMILEFLRGDLNNAFLCLLSLILFLNRFTRYLRNNNIFIYIFGRNTR